MYFQFLLAMVRWILECAHRRCLQTYPAGSFPICLQRPMAQYSLGSGHRLKQSSVRVTADSVGLRAWRPLLQVGADSFEFQFSVFIMLYLLKVGLFYRDLLFSLRIQLSLSTPPLLHALFFPLYFHGTVKIFSK